MTAHPYRGKAQIRTQVLMARNGLSAEERSRYSSHIIGKIVHMAAFRRAEVVMAYSTFGSEVDTRAFVSAVRESGKRLVLQKIDRSRNCLALYRVDDDNGLKEGVWGICEPDPALCASVPPGSWISSWSPG